MKKIYLLFALLVVVAMNVFAIGSVNALGITRSDTLTFASKMSVIRTAADGSTMTTPIQSYTIKLVETAEGTYSMVMNDFKINDGEAAVINVGSITINGIKSTPSKGGENVDTLTYEGTAKVTAGSKGTTWLLADSTVKVDMICTMAGKIFLFATIRVDYNTPVGKETATMLFGDIVNRYDGDMTITIDGVQQATKTASVVTIQHMGTEATLVMPDVVVSDVLALGTIVVNGIDTDNGIILDSATVMRHRGKAYVEEGTDESIDWSMAGDDFVVYLNYEYQDNTVGKLSADLSFKADGHTYDITFGKRIYDEAQTDTLTDVTEVFYQGVSAGKQNDVAAMVTIHDALETMIDLTLENITIPNVGTIGAIAIDSITTQEDWRSNVVDMQFRGDVQILAGDDSNATWLYAGDTKPLTLNGHYFKESGKLQMEITVGDDVRLVYGMMHTGTIKYTADLQVEVDYVPFLQNDKSAELTIIPVYDSAGVLVDTLATLRIEDLVVNGMGIGTIVVDSLEVIADEGKLTLGSFFGYASVEMGSDLSIWWNFAGRSLRGILFGEVYGDDNSLTFEIIILDQNIEQLIYAQYGTAKVENTDDLTMTIDGKATTQTKTVTLLREADQSYTIVIENLQIDGFGGIGTVTIDDIECKSWDGYDLLTCDGEAEVTAGDDPSVTWHYAGQTIQGKLYGEFDSSRQKLYFTLIQDGPIAGKNVSLVFGSSVTSIKDTMAAGDDSNATVKDIFSLSSIRSATMRKGVNLVRMSNGTVKKIIR